MLTAFAVACSGPTVPDVPLSSGVQVSTSPPSKQAIIVSAPPFRWRVTWAVNVLLPEPIRNRDLSVSVHTRVEQADGRLLAESLSGVRRFEPPGDEGVAVGIMQFPQEAVYDKTAPPPSTSFLVITTRLSDGRGRSEEVARREEVLEYLCGAKRQPSCGGAYIAITASGVDQPSVTIRFGQHVTFYSPDGSPHKISSDPHPDHTACPPLNIPEFGPGIPASTSPFLTPGTCRYHEDKFLRKVRGEVVVLPIGSY